ncbi:patatin-like phospholipase family protein [uncultured Algimonas sp.]|uniref:patatin-like phospholipase family protein n=1 Tax=uncultured Algimonas sp. TaxID=1547920 RepID=UPI002624CCF9|nr:patatin-like phospholipase family protein [uncultured Algimonas sp.]
MTACAWLASAFPALACDDDDRDGLDVGLVLSGGGAKASTQVGVLQIMEDLDIPVHCIAGTSMGAVVGAFYAAGYSADEIADILEREDWGTIFRSDLARRDKSFIEKEREEEYFSGDILGLNEGKIVVPGGMRSMQGLKSLYRRLLRGVPLNTDFDALGIPLRVVATRLDTGEAVAFKDGDLVEAILASMAVPGVFAPRRIDGVTYVDGGVASNLPVQTVQDMGADIVIAIDTTGLPQSAENLGTVVDTLRQITTLLIYNNAQADKAKLSEDDLYIFANTLGIATAGYDRAEEGLEAGRAVGQDHADALLAIKARAAPARDRAAPKKRVARIAADIRNESELDDTVLISRLSALDAEDPDPEIVRRRLRELASFGGVGEVDLGYNEGRPTLRVGRHPLGRNRARIGVNATNDFQGGSTYSLLAQVTRQPLNRLGADLTLSTEIGTDNGVSLEFYQPFGRHTRYFFQPEIFAVSQLKTINEGEKRIGDFKIESYGARSRLGRELSQWGLVALEAEYRHNSVSDIVTSLTDFKTLSYSSASVGAYVAVDTLDRLDWPTRGLRLRGRGQQFMEEFDTAEAGDFNIDSIRLETDLLYAFEIGEIGMLLNARYGDLIADDVVLGTDSAFELGGFRQLTAFLEDSLQMETLTFGSVEAYHRISETGFLFDIPVYVGALAEYGRVEADDFGLANRDVYSGSLYLGAETPLGPVFLGTAYGSNEDLKFFFRFGQTF